MTRPTSLELPENLLHLLYGQHDRQPRRFPGTHYVPEPGQVLFKHLLIKKQQCGKRLILSRSRNIPANGKIGKERLHLCCAHFYWVTIIVEPYVALDPLTIDTFSSDRVVFQPDLFTNLIE